MPNKRFSISPFFRFRNVNARLTWDLKGFTYVLALIIFSTQTLVAKPTIYQLDGYMGVQGGESFNYHLDLHDSAGNRLSGYSYTYKQLEDKAVKAYVTAVINRQAKTLEIHEQNLIYNHGFRSKAVICLVNAKLTWQKQDQTLSGPLMTHIIGNGPTCSTGSITFINKEQIENLFAPPKRPVTKALQPATSSSKFEVTIDPNKKLHHYFEQKERRDAAKASYAAAEKIKQQEAKSTHDMPQKPVVKQITAGKDADYTWHSDKIILYIWDGGQIDNDQISIEFNGTRMLTYYTLTSHKKKLVFDATDGLNVITITAENEGGNPPNTANIILQDGRKVHSILAYDNTGKKAVIRIRKVK